MMSDEDCCSINSNCTVHATRSPLLRRLSIRAALRGDFSSSEVSKLAGMRWARGSTLILLGFVRTVLHARKLEPGVKAPARGRYIVRFADDITEATHVAHERRLLKAAPNGTNVRRRFAQPGGWLRGFVAELSADGVAYFQKHGAAVHEDQLMRAYASPRSWGLGVRSLAFVLLPPRLLSRSSRTRGMITHH